MMWPTVFLGEIITLEYGRSLPKKIRETQGMYPVAGSNGVDGYHNEWFVKGPGIVIGRKGSAGKVTWFDSSFWPIDTTFFVKHAQCCNKRWVYYLLLHCNISSLAIKTGVPGINRNDVYRLQVTLPPLSEQRRIVDILDQADVLRRKRDGIDEKMQMLLPALFYKVFGNPQTNSKQLPIVRIGDIVEPVKKINPISYSGKTIRYIDISSVDGTSSSIKGFSEILGCDAPSRARQLVRTNDVIVSTVRPNLRATAIIPQSLDRSIASTGFCVLRSANNISHGFLYALSRLQWFSDSLSNMAKGASYPAVSISDIYSLGVPYEEDMSLHERFNSMIDELNTLSIQRQGSRHTIVKLFSALLYRAFSGDLTAKWREAHMQELLREMEKQNGELGLRIPCKEEGSIKVTHFTKPFMEKKAILLSYIILRSLDSKRRIARVKLAKLYYFVNQFMQEPVTKSFQKMVAGPLDIDIFQALELAQDWKWVVIEPQIGKEKPLSCGVCVTDTEMLASDILGQAKPKVDQFIESSKDWGWETLERWATVHSAAQTLINTKSHVTAASVKSHISTIPEWEAKLMRSEFSDENIEKSLSGLRYWGLLPELQQEEK